MLTRDFKHLVTGTAVNSPYISGILASTTFAPELAIPVEMANVFPHIFRNSMTRTMDADFIIEAFEQDPNAVVLVRDNETQEIRVLANQMSGDWTAVNLLDKWVLVAATNRSPLAVSTAYAMARVYQENGSGPAPAIDSALDVCAFRCTDDGGWEQATSEMDMDDLTATLDLFRLAGQVSAPTP